MTEVRGDSLTDESRSDENVSQKAYEGTKDHS